MVNVAFDEECTFAKEDFTKLQPRSGLYFLCDSSDEVLYIGKSINLPQRLREHKMGLGTKKTSLNRNIISKVKLLFIDGTETELYRQELLFIKKFKPMLNLSGLVVRKKDKITRGVSFTIDSEVLEKVKEIAEKEKRSVSQMVSILLDEAIQNRG